MFVRNSMTKKTIKIEPEFSISTAKSLMEENNIRHLPVVNANGTLVGIVTDRDLRSIIPHKILQSKCFPPEKLDIISKMQVANIMTYNPITVSPSHTIQDALLMIQNKKIGALPVVNTEGKLQGILSVRDLLRSFINILGIDESGTLLGIVVKEKIGQLKKIVDTITEENISVASILIARYKEKNTRAVFTYLLTNNVINIKKKLRNLGYSIINPLEWNIEKNL